MRQSSDTTCLLAGKYCVWAGTISADIPSHRPRVTDPPGTIAAGVAPHGSPGGPARLDSNQEFVGQGLANIAAGLFSGYPRAQRYDQLRILSGGMLGREGANMLSAVEKK
jgi:hypothetical protein